jgi:superfamily II DNA or RNA helicase
MEPNVITICTIQSVIKMQDRLANAEVLMVDEVHDFTSKLSQLTFRACEKAYMRLGFSATPYKLSDVHKYTIMYAYFILSSYYP